MSFHHVDLRECSQQDFYYICAQLLFVLAFWGCVLVRCLRRWVLFPEKGGSAAIPQDPVRHRRKFSCHLETQRELTGHAFLQPANVHVVLRFSAVGFVASPWFCSEPCGGRLSQLSAFLPLRKFRFNGLFVVAAFLRESVVGSWGGIRTKMQNDLASTLSPKRRQCDECSRLMFTK